jgi:hypothetical protein
MKRQRAFLIVLIMFSLSFSFIGSCDDTGTPLFPALLSVNTDNQSYQKGQTLRIFGNVTNISKDTVLNSDVLITLHNGDWMRSITSALSQQGSYEYLYQISYGDPEGSWNITVELQTNSHILRSSKNITVLLPEDTIRYNVIWFSPSTGTVFYRGNTIHVTVFVTENDIGVTNASTTCILPSLEQLSLTEVKQGYYEGVYSIPYDSPTGVWALSVESKTGNGSSVYAGGSMIVVQILPVLLSIQVVEMPSDGFFLGDPIELSVSVQYTNGQAIENAAVNIDIANETYQLQNRGGGIYSINCTDHIHSEGSQRIYFFASDQFGNSGSTPYILSLTKPTVSEFPFIQIIGAVSVIITVILLLYFLNQRRFLLHKKNIQEEIVELEHLRNEAAVNYYTKGTITRQTYDLLQKDHAQRLAELKKDTLPKKERNNKTYFSKKKSE